MSGLAYIQVVKGSYGGRTYHNEVFIKVGEYEGAGKRGGIKVRADGIPNAPKGIFKLAVEDPSYISYVMKPENGPIPRPEDETDEDIIARIAERFEFLETLVEAANNGNIRGLIVSGGAGVGKSYEVERVLKLGSVVDALAWDEDDDAEDNKRRTEVYKGQKKFRPRYTFEKGAMSAVMLFCKLHSYSDKGETVVLDDCDSLFHDIDALNILKAALDTTGPRKLTYNKDSNVLKDRGVPERFEFKGTIIFITNIDFERHIDTKPNSSLTPHLLAMMSRCHYLDLTMQTIRERILRVRHVHETCGFLANHGCTGEAAEEVIEFMMQNASKLREVSLRMAISIAEKRALSPKKWQRMVQVMEFKREHRGT